MVSSKIKLTQPTLCHFCSKSIPEFPQIRNGKKFARKIMFCDSRCFNSYLSANRPFLKVVNMETCGIAQRALTRLEEMKSEILFDKPDSDKVLVGEEIIYELTFIVEGRETVTKGERYGFMR